MQRFEVAVTADSGGRERVSFSGSIDEHADLAAAFARIHGDAILDLSGVERMNSIGVHRFIPLMNAVAARHRISVRALSYPVALQAGCVANLFGDAHLESCLAPYACPRCRAVHTLEVSVDEVRKSGGRAPARRCECGAELDFDELDSYFVVLTEAASR
jgi:hypothetical protein